MERWKKICVFIKRMARSHTLLSGWWWVDQNSAEPSMSLSPFFLGMSL